MQVQRLIVSFCVCLFVAPLKVIDQSNGFHGKGSDNVVISDFNEIIAILLLGVICKIARPAVTSKISTEL